MIKQILENIVNEKYDSVKYHKGVKFDFQKEVIDKFINSKEFIDKAKEADVELDDVVLRRTITDILMRFKSIRRKDKRIWSIDFDYSGIKIKEKFTFDEQEFQDGKYNI